MAQPAQGLSIAPRLNKPRLFGGTEAAWRVLCDLYPTAESPDIIMALVEYCAVKRLDPFKRPVHIVPMYNRKLRRKVQVVMQGINEIETTASRTEKWAGLDLPDYGPLIERTFKGERESDQGQVEQVSVPMRYPDWCAVTVHKLVGGQPRAFSEKLWWEEHYARASFNTEVPNARWQQAPRQMLHKCCLAAVLRRAFPEEGLGYAAEEMEGKETDAGGPVIDGKATDPEREPDPLEPLNEENGTKWLHNLGVLLKEAEDLAAYRAIRQHASVQQKLDSSPGLIRNQIIDMFRETYDRVNPHGEPPPPAGPYDEE
jgi:phage recombination protein Bet